MNEIYKSSLPNIIADEIKERIINKTWKIGEKIPSEKQLSDEFNVNRLTVRLAINKLNTIGILETRTGEGTFVKSIDFYNYINQIVPFLVSSQNLLHILQFEELIFSMYLPKKLDESKTTEIKSLYEELKININVLTEIYKISKKNDKKIISIISKNFWELKKLLVSEIDNTFVKTIYLSLQDAIIENDNNFINSLSPEKYRVLIERLNSLASNYI